MLRSKFTQMHFAAFATTAILLVTSCSTPQSAVSTDHDVAVQSGHSVPAMTGSGQEETSPQMPMMAGADHAAMADSSSNDAAMDGHNGEMGSHGHGEWVAVPAIYSTRVNPAWNDGAAALRGQAIFEQSCVACHGGDGKGTGPAAAALAHAPADLTNHFHNKPGDGDAYLFWRVSEGGLAEPFKSTQSSMPAFKSSLSEAQRWDVVTYIHHVFHEGFPTTADAEMAPPQKAHNDDGHAH